jgi:hypothetical protein
MLYTARKRWRDALHGAQALARPLEEKKMLRHIALTLTLLALLCALACSRAEAPADAPAATPEKSQDAPPPRPALGAPAPQPVAAPPSPDPAPPVLEREEAEDDGEGAKAPLEPQGDATPPKTGMDDIGTTGKGAGSGQGAGYGVGSGKPAKGVESPDKPKRRGKPGDKDDKGDNYMEDFGVE